MWEHVKPVDNVHKKLAHVVEIHMYEFVESKAFALGISKYILAGSSESLHVQRGCLNLSVRRHAFILPPIKEILALMADEGPFRKRTSGIGT